MGRHRRIPLKDGRIVPASKIGNEAGKVNPGLIDHGVLERLGRSDRICSECNIPNDESADKCRGCGSTQLRPRKASYADG